MVVVFSLYLKEDVNEDGSLKPAAIESHKLAETGSVAVTSEAAGEAEDPKVLEEARKKLEGLDVGKDSAEATNDDDVD